MYIVIDRVTPTITGYLNGLKAKNTLLRYWPTTIVDSEEVMDRLYIYRNGSVQDTTAHKKLYNLLNMDVEELRNSEWEGVDSYWIYFKRNEEEGYFIFLQDLKDYIEAAIPLNTSITNTFTYEPLTNEAVLSNADILTLLNNPIDKLTNIQFDLAKVNPMLSAIFFDTDGELFDKTYRVKSQRVVDDQTSVYKALQPNSSSSKRIIYDIEVTFSRIAEVTDPIVEDSIVAIQTYIGNLDSGALPTSRYDAYRQSSRIGGVHAQLKNMYEDRVAIATDDVNLVGTIIPQHPWQSTNAYYIKKSGIEAMKVKTFKTFIGRSIDTDYKEEEAEWWEKLIAIVIAIIIVVVAVLSGGAAAAGLSGAQALFAFATAAAMILSLGILAFSLLAQFAMTMGSYGAALFIQGTIQVLGMLTKVLGIVSMIGSFVTTFATEGLKQLTVDSIMEGLEAVFTKLQKALTQDLLGAMTKMMTTAFEVYSKYIDPPNEGLAAMQDEIEQQEAALEDYTSPESLKKMRVLFESPHANIYDVNEYMQNIPYLMTQGKIDNTTTKYYS